VRTALYCDLSSEHPDDIPFYQQRIPSPPAHLLELGCGTGRILVPLVANCRRILGVDASVAKLARSRRKLAERRLDSSRAQVRLGDTTDLAFGEDFDLVLARFGVFQGLETDRNMRG
jgi:cyclopropane fatty-acyl-phospholipid synthase-like methyltransferase